MVMLSTGVSASAQLGSLIVYALNGSATLAGMPSAIFHLALAATAYPAGRFMDRRGRRPGLVLGFLVGGAGAAFVMLSVSAGRFAGYVVSMLIFSLGAGVGMLSRGVVGDMYPIQRRAGAVGFIVAGGLFGGLLGPAFVALGDRMAHAVNANTLAVPWLFVFLAYAIAAVTLTRLRPDPREISARLHEYYPDGSDAADSEASDAALGRPASPSVAAIVASRPAQAAMISLACAQATMVMLMSTTSLMLSLHGHGTGTISLVLMAHVLGMFALAVPVGRLADRVGRRQVMIGGALLSAASGLVFPLGVESAPWAAASFFLVGLGWSLAFVPGAALLGDISGTATRARVLGINDLFTNLSATAAALLGGVLLARGGEVMVGILAAILGSVPLLAIARAGRTLAPAAPVAAAVPADGAS